MPLFIATGEKVKVDTRDSCYLGRVNSLMRQSPASKARKRALDLHLRLRDARPLHRRRAGGATPTRSPVNEYTVELVRGVTENRPGSTRCIATYAKGWTMDRMPAVDRNVLRIGAFEVLYVDDVPDAVAVSEALNLVRDLSTDESPAFVNGVLGNIVRDRESLVG